ncbi:hypothetical protein [Gymnodinialimonas sp.]
MLPDLAEPEMMKIINQARAERSREMARLIARVFRRRAKADTSVAVAG